MRRDFLPKFRWLANQQTSNMSAVEHPPLNENTHTLKLVMPRNTHTMLGLESYKKTFSLPNLSRRKKPQVFLV
jgi:hypothetical protein